MLTEGKRSTQGPQSCCLTGHGKVDKSQREAAAEKMAFLLLDQDYSYHEMKQLLCMREEGVL
jgi:hypothetical protein